MLEVAPQVRRLLAQRLVLVHAEVGDVGGEGLVEPEVVPPLHRRQVSEPLVAPTRA